MNWMYKLEQKYGRYAIPDLHKYFVFIYFIGIVLSEVGGDAILQYLYFSVPDILSGQIWRLVTWVFCGTTGGIFSLLFLLCLIPMGRHLEHFLGTFRMNVYLFGGIIINTIGGLLVYLVSWLILGVGLPVSLSMYYILLSTFMALAICIPDATVNLYFILPIKMKWMLLVYFLELLYELYNYYKIAGIIGIAILGSQIIFALLNLFLFFFFSRIRLSGKQRKRQQEFRAQMRQPRQNPSGGSTRHKCAICGRTEADDPNLVFRYCSKCAGNKEYCQDHLFTHVHQ